MLNKENFKDRFGDWWREIEPLFDNGTMDKIYSFLKQESERKGSHRIAPASDKTFRCFLETPLEKLKVVMMGLCPYHTAYHDKQVADGLLMSASNHENYIPPSLNKYYEGIENEFHNGLALNGIRTGNLDFLAKQGVLMFNASLTTEIEKAKSHLDVWEPFTKHLFTEVFCNWRIPVIFLGQDAAEFKRYLAPMQWSFTLDHPAYAARSEDKWNTQGAFKKVNKILKDLNQDEIEWMLTNPPF